MIADMATEIEAARALVWQAAWLKDQGRDYARRGAQAKLFASEVSSRATNAAIQVHGGYGYVEEYKVERFLRDAKLTEIGEGTSQVQRLVIARKLLDLRVVYARLGRWPRRAQSTRTRRTIRRYWLFAPTQVWRVMLGLDSDGPGPRCRGRRQGDLPPDHRVGVDVSRRRRRRSPSCPSGAGRRRRRRGAA